MKPQLCPSPTLMPLPRGPMRRFARQLREAALRATNEEAQELDRLERLVRLEAIDVRAGQEILRDVLRGMHERQAA